MARVGVSDYGKLYRWSINEPAHFWAAFWEFADIRASRQPDRTVENPDRMPGARWFPGAELNFAENLLRCGDDQEALVFWDETGRRKAMTYRELRLEVAALAASLADLGVTVGDRVAGYIANLPEAVAAMLATTGLGAIWSSCSPDFGVEGAADRFRQISPKALFAVDGYTYAGKRLDCLARLGELAARLESVKRTVVVPHLRPDPDLSAIPRAVVYERFLGTPREPEFQALAFDHPAFILYSSGTTGAPKCIVHSAGGTLIQHLKELVLHTDLKRDDRIFFATTCGWMMWNWLVSGLAVGATVVLFDGAPLRPAATHLVDMIDAERVTVFGAGAKYFAALEQEGLVPARSHRLDSLRTVLSTGSPLAPESFDYIYASVKRDVCLASISGGTDIVSCFALGNPIGAVYRGELQTAGLGMRVEVFDEVGEPLRPGQKGELVCTQAFPSMPVGFWNDPGGSRYRAAYFERYPGVWHHGDYCERTEHGGFVIWGRSDTVLNPGGVRIGTAEIYSAVESLPEVLEAVAVGYDGPAGEEVTLFVRLPPGRMLDGALEMAVRRRIRARVSPRHVPARVLQVNDIPRTRSGKVAELAVKEALHGRPIRNAEALANPEALDWFRGCIEQDPRFVP